MDTLTDLLKLLLAGFFALLFLYMAARLISYGYFKTRAEYLHPPKGKPDGL